MFEILKYGIIAGIIFTANYINERKDYVCAYAEIVENNDTMVLRTIVTVDEWQNAIQRYITDSIVNSLDTNIVNY